MAGIQKSAALLAALFAFISFGLETKTKPGDPLAEAASYYFDHQDYPQALQLWTESLKKRPESLPIAFRIAELKLLLEGRVQSRDFLLSYLKENISKLTPEALRQIKDKVGALSQVFLSEQAQSLYWQAIPKTGRKDFSGALETLQRATQLEPYQSSILKMKSKAEMELRSYSQYADTIRSLYESNPFDPEVQLTYAETLIWNNHSEEALAVLTAEPHRSRNARESTALAFTFWEKGNRKEALRLIRPLIDRERYWDFDPIVFYLLGKTLSESPETRPDASHYFEAFLSLVDPLPRPANAIAEWDPYRSKEKIEDAKKYLKSPKEEDLKS